MDRRVLVRLKVSHSLVQVPAESGSESAAADSDSDSDLDSEAATDLKPRRA